jgi:N-methyl-L-tryptophan oxidase
MQKSFDVIIIGAGSVGMASGYFLAKQGTKTLLIDAWDPPHTNGSHHGDTRIIRHAYGEGKEYIPLALRAQQLWNELANETGEKVFEPTGVLAVGAPESPFIKEMMAGAKNHSLPLHVLQAKEISRRWPGITIPEEYIGCLEPQAGVLFSEVCIRTYRERAVSFGAVLKTGTPVLAIEREAGGVSVRTKEDTYHGDMVVVSAGAWAGKLLADLRLPLTPVRKTVAWFKSDERLYDSRLFPAFFFDFPTEQYYGFPSFSGGGVKVGRHDGGQKVDPDRIDRTFGIYPEDEGDLRRFLERTMPQAAGKRLRGSVCIYTRTPDEHFIIDRHPENEQILIAAGLTGHGFKFASALGEALCQWVTAGKTDLDLSIFSLNRPALRSTES